MFTRIARRRIAWHHPERAPRFETASELKQAYQEHVFWQWFEQLPYPDQERYYAIGSLLEGLYTILTAEPGKPDERLEGRGYPFQEEAGLRYLELVPGQNPGAPCLAREELDHCLRGAGVLIEEFLQQIIVRSRQHERDPALVRTLAHLHFATFGALVRGKTIKKEFLESCLTVLTERPDTETTAVNLVLAAEQVAGMLEAAKKESPDEIRSRIVSLHTVLSRFPGLAELLARRELLEARSLASAIQEFRAKARELLRDVTFVPDNPKVEFFLRRTALAGFAREFKHEKEPFTRYHSKVVRPGYRAIRDTSLAIDDPVLGDRVTGFLSRITRLMEFLKLVRAHQERKDLDDRFSEAPFQNLALALSINEAHEIVKTFAVTHDDTEIQLDFDSGFAAHDGSGTAPAQELFDPGGPDNGLDAEEVAAAVDRQSVEKTGLDANRVYDLFAIFTWRLGKTVQQLERRLRRLPEEMSGLRHVAPPGPPDRNEQEHRAYDEMVQDFREAVLGQCRQVLWELCHELDDTLTFDAVIPDFREGKARALRLRSQLQALLTRAARYGELVRAVDPLAAMDREDLARRNQLLKQSFLLEVKHFQRAKIELRPDDREIFYAKLRQIALSERPSEIHRQMDDLVHFLEGLAEAVNRRWVLTLFDREQLEECKTEIESLLLGSKEPDREALESLTARLQMLASRSPAFEAATQAIREEILPLVSGAGRETDAQKDSAGIPDLIKTGLEKVHASIAQALEFSL